MEGKLGFNQNGSPEIIRADQKYNLFGSGIDMIVVASRQLPEEMIIKSMLNFVPRADGYGDELRWVMAQGSVPLQGISVVELDEQRIEQRIAAAYPFRPNQGKWVHYWLQGDQRVLGVYRGEDRSMVHLDPYLGPRTLLHGQILVVRNGRLSFKRDTVTMMAERAREDIDRQVENSQQEYREMLREKGLEDAVFEEMVKKGESAVTVR